MAGLTTNGLVIRTQPELQALIEDAIHAEFPGLDLSRGPEHQIVGILSEELAIVWEALQAVHAATYPSGASGILLDKLMALTGSVRRQATRSTVLATVNLNAGVTLPAGSIAAVLGDPDAQFRTLEDVTNGGGSPAAVSALMESIRTGPIAAGAGLLTVIVTPVAGWNSVTNADEATPGRAIAGDVEARQQRVIELAGSGAGTVDAIRADVARVDDVRSVSVYENVTMATDGDGRPAKSFEVVVWDEEIADDDEIAQAIWDAKPAGIQAYGSNASGTATDDAGNDHTVAFTRAVQLQVYVSMEVVLRDDAGPDWEDAVKAAVSARGDEYLVGEAAYGSQLDCAAIDGVAAVIAIAQATRLEAGDPTPDTFSVVPAYNEIVRIAAADVTLTPAA